MRWLSRVLRNLWYWRHDYFPVRPYSLFTMRGTWWCRRCGGEVVTEPIGGAPHVEWSTCPSWRDGERIA